MATKNSKSESIRAVALVGHGKYARAAKSATASVGAGSATDITTVEKAVGELLRYEGKISKKVKTSLGKTQGKLVDVTDSADEVASKLGKKAKSALTEAREKVAKVANKADTASTNWLRRPPRRCPVSPPRAPVLPGCWTTTWLLPPNRWASRVPSCYAR